MNYRVILLTLLIFCGSVSSFAQSFSAYTSYAWDNWQDNKWAYIYSGGWCYAVPGELYRWSGKINPSGNARDFYWRFNIYDLGLHEQSREEWKQLKKDDGWFETTCSFEYYITDQYQTIGSQLEAYSWPCAKYYLSTGKPAVIKTTRAKAKIHFTDDDEVRTINFWIDGYGFAITVHWDYSGNNMTYSY